MESPPIRPTAQTRRNLLRGRFARARLPEVEAFTASLPFDRRLYRCDIRGSIAHVRMLAKVRLISSAEAQRLEKGLRAVEREIDSGRFRFDLADEDIHMAIERRLGELVGPVASKLHTARSRNDQVALDLRLFLSEELETIIAAARGLRRRLLEVAEQHVDTVMPGYTHLQRAQPVSLAHHMLAYVEMFGRDQERFARARESARVMPLGAGALAATTLPIERHAVARELGLRTVSANSLDAVSDRDFAVEFLAAGALCMVHLSRLSEELILWSSTEFGFVVLPDEFSSGSSMMPQKKNPDLLELIRAKSGRVLGNLQALLVVLKGLPLAYNSDLQEDKERVFDTLDTLKPALTLMAKLWPRLHFEREVMRKAAGGWALATDLAEYLVRRGMPFRAAHETVAQLARDAIAERIEPDKMTLPQLKRYSSQFNADALKMLSAERSMHARKVTGGPAPSVVRRRLAQLRKSI
jgi:argininosuccinate lyase